MALSDQKQAWQNLVYTSRGLGSEEDKFSHELAGKYEAALTGDGDAGSRGGPSGDLYLVIQVKEHKLFQV